MKLRNILLVLVLLAFSAPSWAIGIAGSAGGKRVTVSVDGTWQGTYAAGTTYAIGDIATDGTTNYRSLQNANTGHTPASSPLYWQAILTKGDAGPTGATGSQGPTGASGADGKTVLTTSGAPASGTGANGDYAYDPAAYTMYGPKAAGAWPAGTIIKGADGAGFTGGSDGTYGWLTDSNTSSYTECASGKYGLNFVGGVLYQCSNGTNSVFTSGDSLPAQTGNSGKYLTTNGTAASWGSIAAGSGIAISADIPTETGAANLNDTTHVLTVASTTGYTQFTGSYTAWDTTPDAFSFTDLTDVALSTTQTATPVQITGINYPAAVTATGGTAAICTGATVGTCGAFSASPGNIALNQYVSAQHTSSASNSTAVDTVVTIDGVSDTFTSTTAAGGGATYSDGFNRSDQAPIAGDWTASNGEIKIYNQRIEGGAASTHNMAYWSTNSVSDNQYAQVSIVDTTPANNSGPCVRMSSSGATGYCLLVSGTITRIVKILSGTSSDLTSQSDTSTTSDVYKLAASGSTLTAYKNGEVLNTTTDSSISSGSIGVYGWSYSNAIDNWSGGGL